MLMLRCGSGTWRLYHCTRGIGLLEDARLVSHERRVDLVRLGCVTHTVLKAIFHVKVGMTVDSGAAHQVVVVFAMFCRDGK